MALTPKQVKDSIARIQGYLEPYKELFFRREQKSHLEMMLLGMASDLERKSIEPIAVRNGVSRRPLQAFMGINDWDHRPLRDLELKEVDREIGVDDGDLVLDGSGIPKKGTATVGVKRQYCGRLGKVDNCVIGVHAVYVGKDDQAVLVESQLYLPEDWLTDPTNLERTHVPPGTNYRTQPEIALDEFEVLKERLRFQWVHGDDEIGRCQVVRDRVRATERYYCFDVPRDTLILAASRGPGMRKVNQRVDAFVNSLPASAWKRMVAKHGEKGPLEFRVTSRLVCTHREGRLPCRERLLVMEALDGTDRRYTLCHTPKDMAVLELVRRACRRHLVEEVLEQCKGEFGMDHFELRSWHGWHHHMTLVQMAQWFHIREQRWLGKRGSPGLTVSMIRTFVGKLLAPPITPELLADLTNYQMERNEEARRASYAAKKVPVPPRRWEVPHAPRPP